MSQPRNEDAPGQVGKEESGYGDTWQLVFAVVAFLRGKGSALS